MKHWMGFLMAGLLAQGVWANVAEDCQAGASTEANRACNNFIQGFISGALLTDKAIVQSLEKTEGSSFLERAYRTRLGKKPIPPTYLADFCLPDQSMDQLVNNVRRHLVNVNPTLSLGDEVYRVLKHYYPCV